MISQTPSYPLLKAIRACLDQALSAAVKRAASTDDQAEQNMLYPKTQKLKAQIDLISTMLFSEHSAEFQALAANYAGLTEQTRKKLAELEATVDHLKTALEIAQAVDAALEVAAGMAGQVF